MVECTRGYLAGEGGMGWERMGSGYFGRMFGEWIVWRC